MKAIRFIVALSICAACLVITANAQATRPGGAAPAQTPPARPATTAPPVSNEPVPAAKIAIIDTRYFGAEKGIAKLINAYQQLNREFQPKEQELQTLQNRLQAIADEIQKLSNSTVPVDPKTIQAKQDEGERLQREIEYKKKSAEADLQRRDSEIIGPVREEILRALDAFAKSRGITMVLDAGLQGLIVAVPGVDITQAFIADFNAKNPATAAAATPR
jgi:outer membrane protein